LSWLLARNGHAVRIVTRGATEALAINTTGRAARAPTLDLPLRISASTDARTALAGIDALLMAVPSQSVRDNARDVRDFVAAGTMIVHATKGLERHSGKRISEVLLEELPEVVADDVCVLSGPNLAPEIAGGLPGATVVAGIDAANVERAQRLFHSATFRVYASDDPVGVELSGSLKNVVAIVAGIADGLALGDNAKAAIITRALAEITRLGVAAGAQAATFAGLAGVGDVIATSYSPLSRNRTFGDAIGRGASAVDARAEVACVVEGIDATMAACDLARRLEVHLPITESLREVLFEGATPAAMIVRLLQREPGRETD
jgi:glycerol-3-phosphate dehydrogenase (NAD(P)+)